MKTQSYWTEDPLKERKEELIGTDDIWEKYCFNSSKAYGIEFEEPSIEDVIRSIKKYVPGFADPKVCSVEGLYTNDPRWKR